MNRQKTQITSKTASKANSGWLMKAMMALVLLTAMATVSAVQAKPRGTPESFADLVEKLQPAVVNISTVIKVKRPSRRGFNFPMPFMDEETQKRFEEEYKNQPEVESRSLGSGFLISEDGYIVTNNHVVKDATEITIRTVDGEEYEATIKGRAEEVDLALLKVNAKVKFPFVKFGSSTKARVGEWVLAIGNPYGLGGSVTAGIISGKSRRISNGNYDNYIQTDAPINRGNSGGPLFNMDGDVIGVNTVILSPTGGNVGIGFALPSTDVNRVIDQLRQYGETRRGWLGVSIRELDRETAKSFDLSYRYGAVVSAINDDAPSKKAGVKVGDIIVKWDGIKLSETNSLPRLVSATDVGKKVEMVVLRMDGSKFKEITLIVETGLYPKAEKDDMNKGSDRKWQNEDVSKALTIGGMRLERLNGAAIRRFKLDDDIEGVLIANVTPNSEAFKRGLRAGMVIQRVSYQEVDQPEEVIEALTVLKSEGKNNAALFVVMPGGGKTYIPIDIKSFMESDGN